MPAVADFRVSGGRRGERRLLSRAARGDVRDVQNYTRAMRCGFRGQSGGSLSLSENEADADDAVEAGGAESHLFIYFTQRLKQLFTL